MSKFKMRDGQLVTEPLPDELASSLTALIFHRLGNDPYVAQLLAKHGYDAGMVTISGYETLVTDDDA